eukprot:gene3054-2036_t
MSNTTKIQTKHSAFPPLRKTPSVIHNCRAKQICSKQTQKTAQSTPTAHRKPTNTTKPNDTDKLTIKPGNITKLKYNNALTSHCQSPTHLGTERTIKHTRKTHTPQTRKQRTPGYTANNNLK